MTKQTTNDETDDKRRGGMSARLSTLEAGYHLCTMASVETSAIPASTAQLREALRSAASALVAGAEATLSDAGFVVEHPRRIGC
jgi:hypothetical protein